MAGAMQPQERRTDHRHLAPDLLVRRPPMCDRASITQSVSRSAFHSAGNPLSHM
jgi:hypothetical protein